MSVRAHGMLSLVLSVVIALLASPALAQERAHAVDGLLRDLQSADFDKAYPAAQELGSHAQERARIVPALIQAIKTRDWPRCGGDMRDGIARSLGELNAREAVVPLLELAKSDKPIDHECVE